MIKLFSVKVRVGVFQRFAFVIAVHPTDSMCIEHRKSKRRMLLREKASSRAQANCGCKRVRYAAIRLFTDTRGHD